MVYQPSTEIERRISEPSTTAVTAVLAQALLSSPCAFVQLGAVAFHLQIVGVGSDGENTAKPSINIRLGLSDDL